MNKTELKKKLIPQSNDQLMEIIINLFELSKVNKNFLVNIVQPQNDDEILLKYKKIILNEFFPERGEPKLRYSILRDAINEFKKISKKPENVAELMIFYVENGVKFTNEYGDIDEKFYDIISNIYKTALEYIFKNKLEKKFMDKCSNIQANTDGIGWGFHDYITDLFFSYYNDFD